MYPLIKVSFSFDSILSQKSSQRRIVHIFVLKKHLNKDNDYSR
jgi:hypothetical protein